MGFLAGVVTNYILCLNFVFLHAKKTNLGKSVGDKILFVVIGIIGLFINEAGMHIGVEILGISYMIVKVIIAAIVMVWNYIARKMLIFNLSNQKNAETTNNMAKEL